MIVEIEIGRDSLDEIIRRELTEQYEDEVCVGSLGSQKVIKALRRVIKWNSTPQQWKEWKDTHG